MKDIKKLDSQRSQAFQASFPPIRKCLLRSLSSALHWQLPTPPSSAPWDGGPHYGCWTLGLDLGKGMIAAPVARVAAPIGLVGNGHIGNGMLTNGVIAGNGIANGMLANGVIGGHGIVELSQLEPVSLVAQSVSVWSWKSYLCK
ncbi:hypothetical protein CEXT_19161 [Caerostris extrusa]|uniref:Uncharacterized protein n=1 Tax=Caerostris extrusa TaxID=172846 RepID=A0AAV4XCP8_CAEEX|nr:hypothetical protein CEXT_19161 [Caerostris extrusa]